MRPPGTCPAARAPTCSRAPAMSGLVAFRMNRVGWLGLPGLPYLGTFPETNVRLYSVGPDGRRGVVFRSLDAARLLPVLAGRAGFRLPYWWSTMRVRRDGDVVSYASRRRLCRAQARLTMAVRVGERLVRPSDLEHFLTARWGLHAAWYGGRAPLSAQPASALATAPGHAAAAGGEPHRRGRPAVAGGRTRQRPVLAGSPGPYGPPPTPAPRVESSLVLWPATGFSWPASFITGRLRAVLRGWTAKGSLGVVATR